MIGLTSTHRYFFHRAPTDMRKSFDGLCGVVKGAMKRDPQSGDVYVFVNRRRRLLKALVWDRTGFVLFYKRLEVGAIPASVRGAGLCGLSFSLWIGGRNGCIAGIGAMQAASPFSPASEPESRSNDMLKLSGSISDSCARNADKDQNSAMIFA